METSSSLDCPHLRCLGPNPREAGLASQHPLGMKSPDLGVLSSSEVLSNLIPISPSGGRGAVAFPGWQQLYGRAVVEARATYAWASVRKVYFGGSILEESLLLADG